MTESLVSIARRAMANNAAQARQAYDLFASYCAGPMPRVPGMDTVVRLAIRIETDRSVEEAAARGYAYRWHLALMSPTFGVPHTLGA